MYASSGTPLDDWRAAGFSETEAHDWLAAAGNRFTPHTARAWIAEGFGPADAALWSEVYADPVKARERRNAGFTDAMTAPTLIREN